MKALHASGSFWNVHGTKVVIFWQEQETLTHQHIEKCYLQQNVSGTAQLSEEETASVIHLYFLSPLNWSKGAVKKISNAKFKVLDPPIPLCYALQYSIRMTALCYVFCKFNQNDAPNKMIVAYLIITLSPRCNLCWSQRNPFIVFMFTSIYEKMQSFRIMQYTYDQ